MNTYLEIFGRVACPEQNWKSQRLVKIVEYFAASFHQVRLKNLIRRESRWISRAFISECRMLSPLQGLYSMAQKGIYYMVSSDPIFLQSCKSAKQSRHLTPTRPGTHPICLGLGGARSSRHKTKNFSTRLPYQMAGKISTRLGFGA